MSSSSTAVELRAPAKLNLFLEVLGPRPDGYHEIDSVLTRIDLCDRIRIEPADEISLAVEGEAAPADETNLVWRAAAALGVGARIRLEKRIPAGSGLGGGSSDAAAVLRGLNRIYDLGLDGTRLAKIGLSLGADLPFFLSGAALARCRGVGERVETLPSGGPRVFQLLVPELPISTAAVYGALGPGLTKNPENATFLLRRYLAREGPGRVSCFNRLQDAAERLEPCLRGVRGEAENRLGVVFTLTGSGSAYFADVSGISRPLEAFEAPGGVMVRTMLVTTG